MGALTFAYLVSSGHSSRGYGGSYGRTGSHGRPRGPFGGGSKRGCSEPSSDEGTRTEDQIPELLNQVKEKYHSKSLTRVKDLEETLSHIRESSSEKIFEEALKVAISYSEVGDELSARVFEEMRRVTGWGIEDYLTKKYSHFREESFIQLAEQLTGKEELESILFRDLFRAADDSSEENYREAIMAVRPILELEKSFPDHDLTRRSLEIIKSQMRTYGYWERKTLRISGDIADITLGMIKEEEKHGTAKEILDWIDKSKIADRGLVMDITKEYFLRGKISDLAEAVKSLPDFEEQKYTPDRIKKCLLYTSESSKQTGSLVLQTYLLICSKYGPRKEEEVIISEEARQLMDRAEEMLKTYSKKEYALRAHFRVAHDWIEREGYEPAMAFMTKAIEEGRKKIV